ncbi:MAG: transporter substrate-binding domain-containing protein [Pseudomonadota bacterium]
MSTSLRHGARALIAAALLPLCTLPAHAEWQTIRAAGALKVAVYTEFAPFSGKDGGIDVDLAAALAGKLGLKLSLLPFPAGENLGDDLRNMVWKGHYLGYGPADVMLHVPIDRQLMSSNDKVQFFAPYHVENVRLVRNAGRVPVLNGVESLVGKRIGVEKVSLAAMLMLGEADGRYRDQVQIFDTAAAALAQLKAGTVDAVLATRSEIDAAMLGDSRFPVDELRFQRLPRSGWAVGMAVRKDDPETARQLQQALDAMAASGELKAIFARHGVHQSSP